MRLRRAFACLLLFTVSCPGPGEATLDLSVPSFVSNQDPVGGTVRVTVTTAAGTSGTGTVTLTTSSGDLAASVLTLEEGNARTTLRCVAGLHGACTGSAEVTATWSAGGETARATAMVRFGAGSDGGRPDAGTADGGSDGGADGGRVIMARGSALDGGRAFLFGMVEVRGQPGLVGFNRLSMLEGSEVEGLASAEIGWLQPPRTPVLFNESLAYVTPDGLVRLWVSDRLLLPGEVPVQPVDAGRADGGSDGGLRDGGARDAGPADAGRDAGPLDGGATFPPDPEGNDPIVPVPACTAGVESLLADRDGVWAYCRPEFDPQRRLVRLTGTIDLRVPLRENEQPLAISGTTVLFRLRSDAGSPGMMAPDGGPDAGEESDAGADAGVVALDEQSVFVLNGGQRRQVRGSDTRALGAIRPVLGGFDLVTFDLNRRVCSRANITLSGDLTETRAAELTAAGRACLGAVFVPILPPPPEVDAGVVDGGLDGGDEDAGLDAGPDWIPSSDDLLFVERLSDGGAAVFISRRLRDAGFGVIDAGRLIGAPPTDLFARPPTTNLNPDGLGVELQIVTF